MPAENHLVVVEEQRTTSTKVRACVRNGGDAPRPRGESLSTPPAVSQSETPQLPTLPAPAHTLPLPRRLAAKGVRVYGSGNRGAHRFLFAERTSSAFLFERIGRAHFSCIPPTMVGTKDYFWQKQAGTGPLRGTKCYFFPNLCAFAIHNLLFTRHLAGCYYQSVFLRTAKNLSFETIISPIINIVKCS